MFKSLLVLLLLVTAGAAAAPICWQGTASVLVDKKRLILPLRLLLLQKEHVFDELRFVHAKQDYVTSFDCDGADCGIIADGGTFRLVASSDGRTALLNGSFAVDTSESGAPAHVWAEALKSAPILLTRAADAECAKVSGAYQRELEQLEKQ